MGGRRIDTSGPRKDERLSEPMTNSTSTRTRIDGIESRCTDHCASTATYQLTKLKKINKNKLHLIEVKIRCRFIIVISTGVMKKPTTSCDNYFI